MAKSFKNKRFHVGMAAVEGTRGYMQDRHAIILNQGEGKGPSIDFVGVFDGHGPNGGIIADHIARKLPETVMQKFNNNSGESNKENGEDLFKSHISSSHVQVDTNMKNEPFVVTQDGMTGGSTAASLWIKDGYIYSANVGDSRILLCVDGKTKCLTQVHTPKKESELVRISQAGYQVQGDRVGNVLAVSRAFGDYEFKDDNLPPDKQSVTVVPDINLEKLPEKFDFILLGSDGLFDYLTDEAIARYVCKKRARGYSLEKICGRVLNQLENAQTCFGNCPRELDNITMILVVAHAQPDCQDCFSTRRSPIGMAKLAYRKLFG